MIGFKLRLVISALGGLVIYFFPSGGISTPYYLVVLALTLATSFSGTIQFVSQVRARIAHAHAHVSYQTPPNATQGAFFTRISDLSIGGTYLTLLNTFANLGGTWPKFFVLYFVDLLTVKQCVGEGTHSLSLCACVRSLTMGRKPQVRSWPRWAAVWPRTRPTSARRWAGRARWRSTATTRSLPAAS